MRVVSLNLDHGDAAVVRRALKQALERCACSRFPGRTACQDCQALSATLSELDRLVHRPAFGRTPLLTLVAANGYANHDSALDDENEDELGENDRLRLLVGDESVSGNR
jgi:hypothetical protein